MGLPDTGFRGFGKSLFILLLLPAASIIAFKIIPRLHIVLFLEALYTAARFYKQFLAAGVKGVALGAYFYAYFFLGRACNKLVSAVTAYF